jgi:hypothetical protein
LVLTSYGIDVANLNDPVGVTTDAAGDVFISYNNVNNFYGETDIAVYNKSGTYLFSKAIATGPAAVPGALITLGSSAPQLNSALQPGDILDMLPDGEVYAYRPTTGGLAYFTNVAQVSADESHIFDIQTRTYSNFGGSIYLPTADFGDLSVLGSTVVVSGESNGLPFVMRIGFANGVPATAKVLLSSETTDNGSVDSRGVAVNANGTVLTTLPYSPTGNVNAGIDVAVGFDLFFDSDGTSPQVLTFGYPSSLQIDSRGITTDAGGNFVIATGVNGDIVSNPYPGYVMVSSDLRQVSAGIIDTSYLSLNSRAVAVDPTTGRLYETFADLGQTWVFLYQAPLTGFAPGQIRRAYGFDQLSFTDG